MVKYCSPEEVLEYLELAKSVPNYDNGVTTPETVIAVGSSSTSTVYTAKTKLVGDTYTFSYGSAVTATLIDLTETTHYTLNKDIGAFTLTDAGNTLVSTDGVFATYKYAQDIKNTKLQSIIDRNTAKIDEILEQTFQTTNSKIEEQPGRGSYSRVYKPKLNPVLVLKPTLSSDLTSTATTIVLNDTTGLETDDYITLNREVMTISSVDSSTAITVNRAQLSTVAATASTDEELVNVAVQISNTDQGFKPTYRTLDYKTLFDVDVETGAIQLLHINPSEHDDLNLGVYPPHRIFNRMRIYYKYGALSVPEDIKDLCINMSVLELYNSQVGNALSRGTNGFKSEGINSIKDSIKDSIKERKRILIDGF